ncbi:hypothetical protein HTZ77_13485 [Nonomuraea sp. SMC257]|uniref:Uncharacterized protein n=1 Tax=Nonomuraea montanisoli TaxID=2741721 RepID=A0A7Y6M3P3_9ACTN|nr:hypothetical protein [Nonomuraea montanisoli]NUW32434.1 hypothetical protein [Nonomuraea montanisoli]
MSLHGFDGSPAEALTGTGLEDALAVSMPLWRKDRYAQIATVLPAMLYEADAPVATDRSARSLRGRLLHR